MLMLFNIFRLQCKQIDSDLSAGRLFLPRGETSPQTLRQSLLGRGVSFLETVGAIA